MIMPWEEDITPEEENEPEKCCTMAFLIKMEVQR